MRSIFFALLFSLLMISSESMAASSVKVKQAVESYYSQQDIWNVLLMQGHSNLPRPLPPDQPNTPPRPPEDSSDCQPNYPQACVEAICSQLSSFDCDERSELLDITRQCRNVKGECIRSVCSKVSRFSCDDRSELYSVAEMCRGLLQVGCIDYVCSRLSKFECDDLSELREIANQCR